ncbi:FHA domain-containing protein [Stenotrophomonas daejeonensis]|uniref:FHA domain-containing protein n=1 Tax=Stenotrophomonas daejeonensis TaxID=659018 RepID=UPI00137A0268|nr:FHA domain-containing protein [Stenotrophomonas daejeonensis]
MRTLQVHFGNRQQPDQALGPGMQRIVRDASGQVRLGDDSVGPLLLARFCTDERGLWLQVASGVRGIHVNGRPVRRMALLRAGDSVHADGVEMLLRGDCAPATQPPQAPEAITGNGEDQRVLLRGVGGQHHGRAHALNRPRTIGRDAAADIVIDDPVFPELQARFECHGERVLLRDLGSPDGCRVNGVAVRHCWLRAGDQVVFEGNQRFVLEVPLGAAPTYLPAVAEEAVPAAETRPALVARPRQRRWPWLLLSALLMGVLISALLLFGAR